VETGELVIRGAKGRKDRPGMPPNGSADLARADELRDGLTLRVKP